MHLCVVGNGPLSLSDRDFINSPSQCDEVWRFNDMKNMEKGDRCDGRFVRLNQSGNFWGITNPPKNLTRNVPIIQIGESSKKLITPPGCPVKQVLKTHELSYTDCKDCVDGCKSKTPVGYTSGAIGISYFQQRQDVQKITILGMNFMQPKGNGHDTNEKPKMDLCCTKCSIRKTPQNTYFPQKFLDEMAAKRTPSPPASPSPPAWVDAGVLCAILLCILVVALILHRRQRRKP